MLLLGSCILHLALAEVAYEWEARTEARAITRASLPEARAEIAVEPRVKLGWTDDRVEWSADYHPRVSVVQQVSGASLLHRASMRAVWQASANWRLLGDGLFEWGSNDLLRQSIDSMHGAGGTPVQPVPPLSSIEYVLGDLLLAVEGTPAPRYRLRLEAGARTEGGADPPSQAVLPLQRGPRVGAVLEWDASRRDVVTGTIAGRVTSFGPEARDVVVLTMAGMRHAWTARSELRAGAGPAVVSVVRGPASSTEMRPTADLGEREQLIRGLEFDIGARVTPVVDRVTTLVYDRADASLTFTVREGADRSLSASGLGGVVLDGPQAGDWIAAGDIHAAWSPVRAWELAAGLRAFSQLSRGVASSPFSEVSAYVSIAVRDASRF